MELDPMTVPEMIEVLQAFQAGKTIQSCGRYADTISWSVVTSPHWNFEAYRFRVKPEPRTFWVVTHTGTPIDTFLRKEGAEACVKFLHNCANHLRIVEVQEVIEDK